MVETLEQQAVPVRGAKLWPMSVEAYHILGEAGVIANNTELLYGLVYTKMPKSPFHTFLLYRLLPLLQKLNLGGYFVRAEQPLTFANSEPEPDIAVVKGSNSDYRIAHPHTAELVIEICVTSHEYDRSKLRAYAAAQVKECWLVLGPEKQIEVLSGPANGAFQETALHGSGGSIQSNVIPSISVNLNSLFAD